ncbi:hypothetical protein [Nonomuraea sp. NPDC052265]|uniref:hypothetical protein n=1 Tax=Nonomuraea sp. NPDC052265 TaxID=3364374 RepID=UPI0037C8DED4
MTDVILYLIAAFRGGSAAYDRRVNLFPFGWAALALTGTIGAAGLASLVVRARRASDAVMMRAPSGHWTVPVPRGDVPAQFGADFLTQGGSSCQAEGSGGDCGSS